LSLAATGCIDVTAPSCRVDTGSYHDLAIGVTASDSLTSSRCVQFYQISVGAQQNLRVALSSPGLQTFLQLVDDRGTILMNSAATSTLDTATTVRMMIGSGSYALVVIPIKQGQSGKFSLVAATDTSAVGGCVPVWVTAGITTTQTITRSDCAKGPRGSNFYYHLYAAMLQAGQGMHVSEYSTALAPEVTLVGPDGNLPSSPDSLGTTAQASYTIAGQGMYRVWVGSSSQGQVGSYTLQIQ
jgi:hypothetical protein